MNTVDQAIKLVRNWRRHRAVIHPRTVQFMYHWMRGSTELPYPPLKLHLEPTSVCNLRCPMCPQAIDAVKGDTGYIDIDLYRKIVDEAARFTLEINMFFRGEPLLHRRLSELLRYGSQKRVRMHVNTNATMLREREARMLVEDGATKVTISFDGPDKVMYEKMRKGAKYEVTLENVRNFLTIVKEYRENGRPTPYTVMQVILPYDANQSGPSLPPHMRDLLAGLPVDEWDPIWPHGWAGVMQENETVDAQPYGENYHPCNWLWKSLAIYWDGRVASCCADFAADQVIGDLREQSLMDIWNGPQMVALRKLQVEGRYQEAPLCSGCDAVWTKESSSWNLFNWAEKWIRPSDMPTGRLPGHSHAEPVVSPIASDLGPQAVAAVAAARNGFTGPAPVAVPMGVEPSTNGRAMPA